MATMIVLAAGAVAMVAFRDQIVRADPELAGVYAGLGLTVSHVSATHPHRSPSHG
jgi:hypothetical protein